MEIVKLLKKTEIYFVLTLFVLNVYCAFALRGDNIIDPTHATLSAVLLIMASERLFDKKN